MMMMRDLEEEALKYIPISRFLKIQSVITFLIFTARLMSRLIAGSSVLRPQIPQSVKTTPADRQHRNPSAYDEATQSETISFSLKPLNALSQSRDKPFQP